MEKSELSRKLSVRWCDKVGKIRNSGAWFGEDLVQVE